MDAIRRECLTCGAQPDQPCHVVGEPDRLTVQVHSARYGTRSPAQAAGDARVGLSKNRLGRAQSGDGFVLSCPDHGGIDHNEDDGWHDCTEPNHAWGPWGFALVGTHEIRFCGRCGVMEQQSVASGTGDTE